MSGDKAAFGLLKNLSEAFGPSTLEDEVIRLIRKELEPDYHCLRTPHKNLLVYRDQKDPERTIVFQAHTDELGVRPYRYDPDGFIKLTPMGGIPKDVANHMIRFYPTHVRGVLVVRRERNQTAFFADVGAKNDAEAMKMVPYHSNGAYADVEMQESPTQLMGKSLDDRAGCAAIVSVMKTWPRESRNRIIGVFTAREETGNWPVTELYRNMLEINLLPDLIVNVECCPGGPTPGDPNPLAEVGKGIVLVNMDASYEPDSEICRFMEMLARKWRIPSQHMAVREGSGELGRLALGFGVAGYPITIPARYMHCPHSVISKHDFMACIRMIRKIAEDYN
ncbi:hypothetical protein JXA40_07700 [bacterium]|nr:hypothetical protein [candidate division CSSED10-310 bacterium]